ncbi:phage tail tape measure protein [Brevibacterium sp. K11IcPPYGO002]|uniref:phage tail tape measure protein n=1 Tax=Brevibacterium sp. K11IcPPYGO002 TaxID=3058837 RepID=UPI003D8180C5
MVESRSVRVVLAAKVDAFKAEMAAAGKSAVDAAQKTETAWDKSSTGAGKAMAAIGKYQGEMTTAGTAMATFGGVVVGSLGLATKAAMSWESAWTGVLKTVDGTPKQLAKVEDGLRDLAKTLPATHEEIAAVAEAAGQLGIKTDNVVSFTKTMIDMGESTNISAEEAATSLARLANIMGTSQKDFGKMGASIVGLGNNFATTESEIVSMSMRIAAVGKQSGLTEGEVFGLATALSSVGIEAEAGGTAMSLVMKKITKAVGEGGDGLDEFARISGMSSEQFAQAWEQDASSALATFVTGLGEADASGENVNNTLSDLGITGIRESDALLRLAGASDVLTDALKQGNDEYEKGTALAEEAAKRYETAESKIKIAGNSLKDTAITIGGTFLPAVAELADGAAKLATAFGDLPEPVLKVSGALGAIAGTAALAGGAALILVPRIAETVTAFKALKTAMAGSTGAVGKMGRNLGRIKSVAKGAALGLTAVALAAEPLSEWGNSAVEATDETADALQRLSGQIAQSKIDSATLNQAFTDIVAPTDELGEFGHAVQEVINPNAWGVLGDVVTDTARVLTLGMVDMTSSTEEARARFEQLGEQIATMDTESASAAFNQMVAETDGSKESIANLIDLMPAYKDQLIDTANALGMNTDNATLAKIATEGLGNTAEGAAGAVGGVGDAADSAAQGLQDMLDGLLALGLATLDERESMRQYESAIDGVNESIKENGTSLDITTEKGRANQEAFDAIADAGMRAADSMVQNGADQKTVQDQLQRTYDDLIDAAGQFGITGKKAEDMAKEVMGIPKDVDIKTWMSDAAQKQAIDLKKELEKLDGKTVRTFIKVEETYIRKNQGDATYSRDRYGNAPAARARGGIDLMPMASGGVLSDIAQMVPPNTWRLVGDRMDVDEAFIPLDGSERSWKILAEAMQRMPGTMPMASGGTLNMSAGNTLNVGSSGDQTGLTMQGIAASTLEAMEQMRSEVSEGWAAMLRSMQETQAEMLLGTQAQNAAMLLDTQTQQEAMRATVAAKQAGQLSVSTEQQELMRLMLIDKQSQMLSKSSTDFESLKSTTGTKFSDMRKNTDTTMAGMYGDYDTRLASLKGLNKRGFESLLSTSNTNMEGVRDGIDAQMAAARPELGGRMNDLISVLAAFTTSVNKAFGEVGVELSAPAALKYADGGVMPGYTPGRDVHHFRSPSAGDLWLSGGEGIIRPETVRMIGGEQGVHALNAAARRGDSDTVTHMLRGMAFADGGVIPRIPGVNAFADAGVWRNLWAITRDQFPNARLTSAYRGGSRTVSGNASYHSRGMAIDVSPSMDIFNFWRNKYGANLAELIYSPANGKQIKNGQNYTYGGAVRAQHFNHVHIAARQALSDAVAGGLPGMGGAMSHPFLDRAGVTAGSDLEASYAKAAEKLTQQIYAKHAKQLPDGIAGQLGKGIMSQVSEGLVGKATEYGKTTAVNGSSAGDPAVKAAVRKIAEQMGWGKYWGDIDWLVNKESSWNPNAANPSSSARGLFQKMTSLHGPVEDTVEGQARWGLNYIKSTYGNPAAARAHHQRSNWYEGGTERAKRGLAVVGEEGPELVNFQGGEQVMSTADSMKFMAANRTYIPNTAPAFDAAVMSSSIASAVKGMQVTPEQIATAFDGVPLQLVMKDGTQMDAYMKKQIGQVAVGAGRAH